MPYIFKYKGQVVGDIDYDKMIQAVRLLEYPEGPTIGKIPMSSDEWNRDYKSKPLIERFSMLNKIYGDKE